MKDLEWTTLLRGSLVISKRYPYFLLLQLGGYGHAMRGWTGPDRWGWGIRATPEVEFDSLSVVRVQTLAAMDQPSIHARHFRVSAIRKPVYGYFWYGLVDGSLCVDISDIPYKKPFRPKYIHKGIAVPELEASTFYDFYCECR